MSNTITAHLCNAQQAHAAIEHAYRTVKPWLLAGHRFDLTIKPERRSLDQNAAQWPYLEAFSAQLIWPVNGQFVTMSPEEWKDVLTAAFHNETVRIAMGLNGGVVMLGQRTSKMRRAKFSEWLEFLKATAADRGVTVYADESNETNPPEQA